MATIKSERQAVQRAMKAIIAESQRSASQAALPGMDRIMSRPSAAGEGAPLPDRVAELVYVIPARRRLEDLVLQEEVVEQLSEFIDEFSNAALLRAHSLEPRHTVLLVGPPGNGKTSLAEVLATELGLPLLSLRYDAIVDSFLGETSSRLRKLIEYATLNPCVLFFDEFDAVGKERSDAQETGEIKRVVSSLLVQMDRLPTHTLVVCATNHPELLDRAVWRRFELKLDIERPSRKQLVAWFKQFELSMSGPLGLSAEKFAKLMDGQNMSAVEAFSLDVRRKLVLARGKMSPAQAVQFVLRRGKLVIAITDGEEGDGKRVPDVAPKARRGRRADSEPPPPPFSQQDPV
jgi:SpoVK/Ycf46/Vps4 family AAA+-type ATPase